MRRPYHGNRNAFTQLARGEMSLEDYLKLQSSTKNTPRLPDGSPECQETCIVHDSGTPRLLGDIPKWQAACIVYDGETPWWSIENLVDRRNTYVRQFSRMWRKLHPGAAASAHNRYRRTPKGRVALARRYAKRRSSTTDADSYAARVEHLHSIRESCASCHTPYKITYQIDHIVALCLGGTDNWDNLQPLCIPCHKVKSMVDMNKHNKVLSRRAS